MAIDKTIWSKIRADYEAGNIDEDKAFTQLSKAYSVNRTTITKKAKKEDWQYGKNSHIVTLEASAIKGIQKVSEEKAHLNHTEITAIENGVKKQLEKEEINNTTMHLAKMMQAQLLEAIPNMKIDDLKPKDITGALKDIHDIANPQTSKTEINNTNSTQNIVTVEIE